MSKLTSSQRRALPDTSFVEKKKRKYPIEDASHARNALARVAQHGTQPEQAAVRAEVRRRYPGIKMTGGR